MFISNHFLPHWFFLPVGLLYPSATLSRCRTMLYLDKRSQESTLMKHSCSFNVSISISLQFFIAWSQEAEVGNCIIQDCKKILLSVGIAACECSMRGWNTQIPRGPFKYPGPKPFCLTDTTKVYSSWIRLILVLFIYCFVNLGLFFKPAAFKNC